MLMILNDLKESKDVIAVSNASLHFRRLLPEKRLLAQFPAVLEQLVKHASRHQVGDDEDTLELQDILNLRSVCKTWKDGIDEGLPKNNLLSVRPEPEKILRPIPDRYDFCITEDGFADADAEQFLRHFARSHQPQRANPFCTRSVTVTIRRELDWPGDEGWLMGAFNAVRDMLTCYGTHIWNLKLDTARSLSFEDFHRLHELVQLTPNLKSLACRVGNSRFWSEEQEALISFPKLENLAEVHFSGAPASLLGSLMQSSNSLTRLTLGFNTCAALVTNALPNLKELEVKCHSHEEFLALDVPQVKFPLEKLSVIFSDDESKTNGEIIRMLNRKWSNSLSDLSICFLGPFYTDEIGFLRQAPKRLPKLRLPHLERLTLEFYRYYSWGFITPVKNTLKFLQLQYNTGMVPTIYSERCQAAYYFCLDKWMKALKKPLEANIIWETFPHLKVLQCWDIGRLVHRSTAGDGLETQTYTRAEWQGKQGLL